MKKYLSKLWLVAILALITACGGNNTTPAPNQPQNQPTEVTQTSTVSHADEVEKHNAFIDVINIKTGFMEFFIYSTYFRQVGFEELPNLDGVDLENIFGFGGADVAEIHLPRIVPAREFALSEPDWGLADETMLDFLDAFHDMMYLFFVEYATYVMSGEHQQDNFARGNVYHLRMIEYFFHWQDTFDIFIAAFQPIILSFAGADLPIFEELGLYTRFAILRLILTSQEIEMKFNALTAQGLDFLDADLSEYERLFGLFQYDLQALEVLTADAAQLEYEGFSGLDLDHLYLFMDSARRMEVAGIDTQNMIIAGTTEIDYHALMDRVTTPGRNVPIARFINGIDELINRYNHMIN